MNENVSAAYGALDRLIQFTDTALAKIVNVLGVPQLSDDDALEEFEQDCQSGKRFRRCQCHRSSHGVIANNSCSCCDCSEFVR